MLGTLGLFSGLFSAWWMILWWALPISWQKMSPTALMLLHVAPPIIIGIGYRVWQSIQEKRAAQAEADATSTAEAERVAQREAARDQHAQQLAERQHSVSCRGVWAQAMTIGAEEPDWLSELPDGVFWQTQIEDEIDASIELTEALASNIEHVLVDLYASAPGAAWLPHYFEALPQIEGREQLALVQGAQNKAIAAQIFDEEAHADVRFLPGSGALMARVQQLLQQNLAAPGVVILAADSPIVAKGELDEWDMLDPELNSRNPWLGITSQATVAMVFLRDTLPEVLKPELAEQNEHDVYTPYWEKQQSYGNELWGRVPPQWQVSLAELPTLAQLHQAEAAEVESTQLQVLTRKLHTMFDHALINAGLRDYPFSEADKDPAKDQAHSIAWLVHNSGDVDVGANRLAAVSSALNAFEVPLNPIDDASNIVREWGDVGAARSALQTALAITHSARLAAPTVLAEFHSPDLNAAEPSTAMIISILRPQENPA
ncbi:hypothetical protein HZU75_07060 [Chitinibacter fontanus]|uniref:Uncharacterized protein n=1 Tax=Chitinibacter fontanus TaxID=1737446 RepID=A0A7D5Z6G5_9NEIS|nr:hypothetical protein [Chitinibacter fontanus]QLI81302.1 hypothetical protein HZU75_07060 [Chitinibacter fontanus]